MSTKKKDSCKRKRDYKNQDKIKKRQALCASENHEKKGDDIKKENDWGWEQFKTIVSLPKSTQLKYSCVEKVHSNLTCFLKRKSNIAYYSKIAALKRLDVILKQHTPFFESKTRHIQCLEKKHQVKNLVTIEEGSFFDGLPICEDCIGNVHKRVLSVEPNDFQCILDDFSQLYSEPLRYTDYEPLFVEPFRDFEGFSVFCQEGMTLIKTIVPEILTCLVLFQRSFFQDIQCWIHRNAPWSIIYVRDSVCTIQWERLSDVPKKYTWFFDSNVGTLFMMRDFISSLLNKLDGIQDCSSPVSEVPPDTIVHIFVRSMYKGVSGAHKKQVAEDEEKHGPIKVRVRNMFQSKQWENFLIERNMIAPAIGCKLPSNHLGWLILPNSISVYTGCEVLACTSNLSCFIVRNLTDLNQMFLYSTLERKQKLYLCPSGEQIPIFAHLEAGIRYMLSRESDGMIFPYLADLFSSLIDMSFPYQIANTVLKYFLSQEEASIFPSFGR